MSGGRKKVHLTEKFTPRRGDGPPFREKMDGRTEPVCRTGITLCLLNPEEPSDYDKDLRDERDGMGRRPQRSSSGVFRGREGPDGRGRAS